MELAKYSLDLQDSFGYFNSTPSMVPKKKHSDKRSVFFTYQFCQNPTVSFERVERWELVSLVYFLGHFFCHIFYWLSNLGEYLLHIVDCCVAFIVELLKISLAVFCFCCVLPCF